MMLTLVTPVYAEAIEGQTTIKLKIRPQQGEWKYIEKTYSGRDNSTYYAVELYAETDEETFKLSGAQFYLNFDKDVLEFRTLKSTDDDSIKYDEEDSENALNVTQPTPSECNSKGYVPLILSCNTNHVLKSGITLVTAVFTVKQNAESGIANFTLAAPENAEKETMCSFNVTENGKPVVTSHTVDDSATATITINGVAPTLGSVALPADARVDGTTGATVNATATSTSNKDITGLVTWSISGEADSGVSIKAATGVITVDAKAKAGLYTVTATAKTGESQGESKTATLRVTRAPSIYTIQFEQNEKQTSIPASGSGTVNFSATGVDQYGQTTSSFSWSIEPAGKGVTVSGGVVTVTAEAAKHIANRQEFAVTASAGVGSSGTAKLVVYRDTAPAKIEIAGAGSIDIPITREKKERYTATVYDQYGTKIEDANVTWALRNESEGDTFSQKGVTIENGVVTVTKEAAGNPFPNGTSRLVFIEATCGDATERTSFTLTRQPAEVTRIVIEGIHSAALCKVPTMDDNENFEHALTVKKTDQYGVTTEAAANEVTWDKLSVLGVTLQNGTLTIQPAAAGNDFTTDEYGNLAHSFDIKATCGGKDATKTITLTRQQSVATAITYNDTETTVVPTDDAQVPTKATPAVEDQYGLLMMDAKVEPDGALPTGIVLKNDELYITKAAVEHFGDERKDEVQVFVKLKCAPAKNTAKLKLKLAAAQINKDSAEITGSANIAKPTGEQANTAEYSIGAIVDQYGLPMQNVDRSKLSLKLYSDAACRNEVTNGPVTLSGNTITVTSGAKVNTKYYLMAYYNDQQCSGATPITITNKATSETPLNVVQGDITYGETVSPSVSNKPETAGTITYTYVGRDGTTYNSSDAPTNAGKYTVTATCEDANYIYTGSKDFEIKPKALTAAMLTINSTNLVYNGQNQSPVYEVKDGNTALNTNAHYDVTSGSTGKDAGAYTLRITGKGNYTGTVEKAWSIEKATLTVTGADIPAINYDPDFDGALNVNSVTFSGLMNGETLTKDTDYTVSGFTNAKNAGTHRGEAAITVTLNENGTAKNYKFAGSTALLDGRRVVVSGDVTINKIDHQAEAVSVGGKYGSTVRVPLAEYLPDGWSVQQSAISVDSNGNGNVHKSYRLDGTTLVVELNNSEALVGKYVKITLPVASTNYNNFNITVTVTVQGKETQTVTASDLNVTYGDAGVKLNASALDNAELAYQVTEGDAVIAVDANGNVTLLKSGTAKIQITAAETEDYGTANTTVTVTVAKRSLTVKANDLTAYVGGQQPELTYTVTGLVNGDTLTTVPELELKDVPAGVDPMKTAGTYTIGFKTAPVADKDKYDLTVETGTLTVSSRPNVNPVPAGNSVKLEEAAGGKLTSSVSRATKGTTVTITVKPDAGYQLEELEVLDKNGEALPLKELANGKFSFQMPDSKVTVQASFVQESTYAGYPDVLPQDWFYSSVRYVTERGLMNGTPNGFEPNMDSSRATIWTILARFSGVDTTVVSGEWYAVARQWAMENGVSDGTNPNGVITREQLATMLYRFAKNKGLVQEPVTADLSVFVDAGQISDYALDAMRWAVSVGLLNGMDGSRLAPQGSAARAQVAAMLMRFDQLAK